MNADRASIVDNDRFRARAATPTNAGDVAYNRTAVALHWLIAAAVFAQLTLGWWMTGIPKSPPGVRAWWFNLHKSIGLTLLGLVAVRLAWRLAHRAPPWPSFLPGWQRRAAAATHAALYACLIAIPVSGYLGSSFTRYPIRYFGHVLPGWGWESPVLKTWMSAIHYGAVVVLMALVAAHVGAALKHLLVDRDGIFRRMWRW